jgi:hypothetical protein
MYGRAFFDLQLRFAQRVTALSGLALADALLQYTNLYARFGLGRDFDPGHPVWRQYVAGLRDTGDTQEWTYRFYLARPEAEPPGIVATRGCFSYARLSGDRIRLHFRSAESDGRSALGIDRRGHRTAELAALFEHLRRTADGPVRVIGASWLYNLDAYRRLFPVSYLATARVAARRFQHMPLWGQFLDRYGALRESTTRPFLDRLDRQSNLDTLEQCFPFQVLTLEAPAPDFYALYGIETPGRSDGSGTRVW